MKFKEVLPNEYNWLLGYSILTKKKQTKQKQTINICSALKGLPPVRKQLDQFIVRFDYIIKIIKDLLLFIKTGKKPNNINKNYLRHCRSDHF